MLPVNWPTGKLGRRQELEDEPENVGAPVLHKWLKRSLEQTFLQKMLHAVQGEVPVSCQLCCRRRQLGTHRVCVWCLANISADSCWRGFSPVETDGRGLGFGGAKQGA